MFSPFLAGRPNRQVSNLPAIDTSESHDRTHIGDHAKTALLQQPAVSPAGAAKSAGIHIELMGEATT